MPAQLEKAKATLKTALKRAQALGDLIAGGRQLLAVDLGSYAIKAALITEEGGAFHLKAWGHIPLALKPEATPEERKARSVNALRAFLIEKAGKIKSAATSLSGNSVIVRYVKFPRLTSDELSATLATEAEPFIPFDINEVQLGFHILGEITEEGQKKMETVLVAAKKDLVASRLEILQEAGLSPAVIDVDSFALENVHEKLPAASPEPGAALYLNIGHLVTNLSIIENGVTRVVRDIFIAGSTITKAVMKALSCDYARAEELKKASGLIVETSEKETFLQEGKNEELGASQAMGQIIKDLVGEVHRSVDFYLSQGAERSIARIALSGGSAALPNLSQYLSAELKVPVGVLNPLAFVKNPPADFPAELAPAFGVAAGLALRRRGDRA